MDKRKYISSSSALQCIFFIWLVAIAVGHFDADWFTVAASLTAGIALCEAQYSTKIDNENAANRKESE